MREFASAGPHGGEPDGASLPRAARKLHKGTPQRHNRARHHHSRALTHAGPRPARRRLPGAREVHHGVERARPSTPTVCHHTAPPPCQRRSPVASVRLLSWSRRAASMRRPLQPSDAAAGPRAEELPEGAAEPTAIRSSTGALRRSRHVPPTSISAALRWWAGSPLVAAVGPRVPPPGARSRRTREHLGLLAPQAGRPRRTRVPRQLGLILRRRLVRGGRRARRSWQW
jgi:hypothetical protein